MKKYFKILFVITLSAFTFGCGGDETHIKYWDEDGYLIKDYLLDDEILAANKNDNNFYSEYSIAEILEYPDPDDEEYEYKVEFRVGELEGETHWTEDVILESTPAFSGELRKGMVVLRNYWNPSDNTRVRTDRWHKAVVYDLSRIKKGIVTLEFPRDHNDFIAAKESIYLHNIRAIRKPRMRDPRRFLK